jgi:hypothetical protein
MEHEQDITTEQQSSSKSLQWIRLIAALLLLGAAGAFLLEGWGGMASLTRLTSFLVLTGAIAGTGVLCGIGLGDKKGARVGLAAAAALGPVSFAQAGAMLYAYCGGVLPNHFPQSFLFTAPDLMVAVSGVVISTVIVLPILYLAFSALVREVAIPFTAMTAIGCSALLLPIRDPDLIGTLLLAFTGVTIAFERYILCSHGRLPEWESRMSKWISYTPLGIIVARSLILYGTSQLFVSMMWFSIGLLTLAVFAEGNTKKKGLRTLTLLFGGFCLSYGWSLGITEVAFSPDPNVGARLPDWLAFPIVLLPTACVGIALSYVLPIGGRSIRILSAGHAMITLFLQLVVFEGIFSSILIFSSFTILLVAGSIFSDTDYFKLALVGLALAVLYHLKYAFELYTVNPWLVMISFGITLLLCAAYLEQNMERVRRFLRDQVAPLIPRTERSEDEAVHTNG